MDEVKECCPNCKTELEIDDIGDAQGGNILISVQVEYCPECLYIHDSSVSISK
jgi:hypothetical protein